MVVLNTAEYGGVERCCGRRSSSSSSCYQSSHSMNGVAAGVVSKLSFKGVLGRPTKPLGRYQFANSTTTFLYAMIA
jgi:hypothetical protein